MAKNITFQGLRIHIENEVGTTRKGVDSNGKSWEVTMTNDYGEIIGSKGVDGDPVDVFLGPYKHAKFVYVISTIDTQSGGYDENKVMLGFSDAMEAKQAFDKNYNGDHHYGDMSTMSVKEFKKKILETKRDPTLIRASKLETAIQLFASKNSPNPFKVGDPVIVDGKQGRGVVVGIEGRRVKIQFRNQMYLSRDFLYVHSMAQNDYKSKYSSLRS